MRRLPLDTSSFKQIREAGDLYVDKTRWISRLFEIGRCFFLSRPRRFGKSLTINTLKELFRGNEKLFEGLYLFDKWEFKPHPVLIFDFNSIDRKDPKRLEEGLHLALEDYAEIYEVPLKSSKALDKVFDSFIQALYRKYQRPVVILVDEYDKPIIDHLGLGPERLEIAKQNREVLKNFFGVLKGAGVVDEIGFIFVTGVSYFSKVSIFSEWNNLIDLTTHPEFADFLGYSEEEISSNFKEYLDLFCQEKGFSKPEECLEEIRYWYNGYRFSPDREVRVYNPISVMYCLQQRSFKNFWFQTGTPTFLVNWLKENPAKIITLEQLKVPEDFLKVFEIENLTVEAVLYQAGYLTIKSIEDHYWFLSYPNREVKESFTGILLQGLSDGEMGPRVLADDLGKALHRGDWEEVQEILNEILAEIPYPLYAKADERFFHTIFYLTLNLLGYKVEAEVLNHRGRLDMVAKFPDGKIFVFEFKAGGKAEEALEQIQKKGYAQRFRRQARELYEVGIVFDPRERKIIELKVSPAKE